MAEKTRSNGTMTEAAFWTMIRSTLRQRSRWWKPISACKQDAKRKNQGPNKRQKFEYQCNKCKGWYADKDTQVDHVVEVGTLKCAEDLPTFVENLFCEKDNLQCLCLNCHNKKTQAAKADKKNTK